MPHRTVMPWTRLLFVITLSLSLFGCFDDYDDKVISNVDIKTFVWKGLNAVYLYKDDVSDLSNDRFNSNLELRQFVADYQSPEVLFDHLIYNTKDRFSIIVPDYNVLEQIFAGNNQTNGMEFGLVMSPDSNYEVIGFVKYILPNSNASTKNLKRGDIFYAIDGTPLTLSNYRSLIGASSYTLNLATYDAQNETLTPNNTSVSLSKTNYSENPIYINQVINTGNNKVGYLMYNGFIGSATNDLALNNVFGEFKSEGVNELVLDLRYNPGGSVRSAIWLASMITGDYTGETLIKRQWNSEIQQSFEEENPEALIDTFQDAIVYRNSNGETVVNESINHLNLNRIYVLTSPNSASASELVINGLKPYIEVIQIGTNTAGKYQASTTIYDSPELVNKQGVNPLHNYALQPLIFKISNANDVSDFDDGLSPSITYEEQLGAFGILGDIEEPLLKKALNAIEGISDDRLSRTESKSLQLIKPKDNYKELMYLSLDN